MQTRSKLVFSKLILFSILVGFLVVGLSTVPVSAQGGSEQWLAFGPETEGNLPEVELLSASGTSIEIQATMPGAKLGETTIAGQNYLTLTGEGYTFNGPEGAPSLPVLRRMIEVPLGAQVSLELLKADSQIVSLAHLGLGAQIAPIQPSQPKCGDPIEPCSPSAQIYGGGYYPAEYLSITDDYIIRGHRIVIVEIRPV
ncbi:MAG: hypothetical protein PHW11_03305, partial [Anaerolineaceae bacterium]|nr:hypothetical protein [Anaerolineaceae bacterium]